MIVARPLTIGEIFDRAVTLLARRWRAVLVLALLIGLPTSLGTLVATYAHHGGAANGFVLLLYTAGIVVGVPLFLAVASLLFVFELGFTIAVLEHVGGRAGLKAAWRRAFHDGRGRAWRLAVASLAAYLAPVLVFESAGAQLAQLPGLGWVPAATSLAENLTAFTFFNAVLAVASVDYRVRAEGADLEAVLDAPLPA